MKVMTVLGTRPEIIRLSEVIRALDRFSEHYLVHTGQNDDPNLSDIIFDDLRVRKPDVHLGINESIFSRQVGKIMASIGDVFEREKPDRLLVLGDTNSGLSALIAARMGIWVYHMEAGNRCFDNRVPEETNRRVIDHCSDVLMPYTHRSKENLIREGVRRERIFVTGNPIYEVIQKHMPRIEQSDSLERMNVEKNNFFLATIHRAENVDQPERLKQILSALERVSQEYQFPVVLSLHPRTADKMNQGEIQVGEGVHLNIPMKFTDFVRLELDAFCVLTDSGTVQEECTIFKIPSVTIRDVTERPETQECGGNILSGGNAEEILKATKIATSFPPSWSAPEEYRAENVSATVAKIVMGFHYDPNFG